MRPQVLQNFRGARALVLHPADANRATLARTLRRLGLEVAEADAEGAPPAGPWDVVFFDADRPQDERLVPQEEAPAFVALVGLEAPSRLLGVVRRRCGGYLMKPIRAAGVYTALVIALNEHAIRRREADERAALAARLAGRREVVKAILKAMAAEGLDDEEAFRRLRRESMRRRLSIEALARERLAADPGADGAGELKWSKRSL